MHQSDEEDMWNVSSKSIFFTTLLMPEYSQMAAYMFIHRCIFVMQHLYELIRVCRIPFSGTGAMRLNADGIFLYDSSDVLRLH